MQLRHRTRLALQHRTCMAPRNGDRELDMVAPAATEVLERLARERFEARTSLEEEVAGVRAHLQFAKSQVAALLQSTSWRITAPIRRTKTLARHCRGILSRIRLLGCTALSSLRERGVSDTWRRFARGSSARGRAPPRTTPTPRPCLSRLFIAARLPRAPPPSCTSGCSFWPSSACRNARSIASCKRGTISACLAFPPARFSIGARRPRREPLSRRIRL